MTEIRAQVRRPSAAATSRLLPELELIVAGEHSDPHRVLGLHDGVVRAYRPDALAMRVIPLDASAPPASGPGDSGGAGGAGGPGEAIDMVRVHPAGVFEASVPEGTDHYLLEADYGRPGFLTTFAFHDPYRAWPTLGELDLHLLGEGRHHRLWTVLGAHPRVHQGVEGVSFAVWAPNAHAVRVVGDWNLWDGRVHQMRALGGSGVWELFIPGVEPGARYKYELITPSHELHLKADPLAFATEVPPGTASVISSRRVHQWSDADAAWLAERALQPAHERPLSIYEMHIGSWRWSEEGGQWRSLTYRELADQLPGYLSDMGFTHVEFLPVAEHPFGGSWGYQVSAYYAPTARYGTPDDFRNLVDALHQAGIGVIVDWVPAHFPRDEFALARFDGTALYEHEDPRRGTQPDWGTLVFNFGRNEVRNFLVANALFWLEEYHIDGLRVDAVASMLYLDYSRKEGEWIPNAYGGRENLEAVAFLKETNEAVYDAHPGALMVAEESTAWPAVSRPSYLGGLGFGFKWNMGWMHDTLEYFSKDPLFRRYHGHELTFGLLYAWSENFVLPLSHDEVVHGKASLLSKMPGDRWQQFANLRALFGWMWAHPGKQLLFMGSELAEGREWSSDRSLDWDLLQYPEHAGVRSLLQALNRLYRERPALWELDTTGEGFRWIDATDSDNSVLSFLRFGRPVDRGVRGAAEGAAGGIPGGGPGGGPGISGGGPGISGGGPGIVGGIPGGGPGIAGGGDQPVLACIANLTPVPHHGYRIGLPMAGRWREVLNTDSEFFGGSGMGNGGEVVATPTSWHGLPASIELTLPPLSVLWLEPAD